MLCCLSAYRKVHQTPETFDRIQTICLVVDVAGVAILLLSGVFALVSLQGFAQGSSFIHQFGNVKWMGAAALMAAGLTGIFFDALILGSQNSQPISLKKAVEQPHADHVALKAEPLKVSKPVLLKSNHFTFTPKLGISNPSPHELTLTSLNVGMLPSFINRLQRLGIKVSNLFRNKAITRLVSAEQRAAVLAPILSQKKSDVLCVQEVFCSAASSQIVQQLAQDYDVVKGVGPSSFCSLNSGLFFASLHPVVESGIAFYQFTNLGAEDAYAAKGLLRVPVMVKSPQGAAGEVIFYNTHLQSKLGNGYTEIRKHQLLAILETIAADQKLNPRSPIFLLGDLNISLNLDEDERAFKECFFSKFHDFHLVDHATNGVRVSGQPKYLHEGVHAVTEPLGSFYDMHKHNSTELSLRLDYCLLYKGHPQDFSTLNAHSELRRFAEYPGFAPPLLSDHLPLTTHLNLSALFALYQSA